MFGVDILPVWTFALRGCIKTSHGPLASRGNIAPLSVWSPVFCMCRLNARAIQSHTFRSRRDIERLRAESHCDV